MNKGDHLIWSNYYLDIDDWRDDLLEENPNMTEIQMWERISEINSDYLDDEHENLDIQLSMPIIAICDIGRWDGRTPGYQLIKSGNIKDCLYNSCDYVTWYVDHHGNLRAEAIHHDGVNYYLYRVFKEGLTDSQMQLFTEKAYFGKVTASDISRYTRRLGDEIGRVYGWTFPSRQGVRQQNYAR